jgi:hypothetical protein
MKRFIVLTRFAAEKAQLAGSFDTPSEAGVYIDSHPDEFEGNDPFLVDRVTKTAYLSYSPQTVQKAISEAAAGEVTREGEMNFVVWHEYGPLNEMVHTDDPILDAI